MSEKLNRCHLELVLLFDSRDESYSICSHNRSAEDARRKLNELGGEGLFAFTVDQPSHHAVDNPDVTAPRVARNSHVFWPRTSKPQA